MIVSLVAPLACARTGVTSHHRPFATMPPVPGLTDAEIAALISHIREVQKANGIY